jgi:hypothetical protein
MLYFYCVLAVRCCQTVSKLTVSLQYSMYVPYGVVPDCDLAVQYYQRTTTDCVLTVQSVPYGALPDSDLAVQSVPYGALPDCGLAVQYVSFRAVPDGVPAIYSVFTCSGSTVCAPWCCT